MERSSPTSWKSLLSVEPTYQENLSLVKNQVPSIWLVVFKSLMWLMGFVDNDTIETKGDLIVDFSETNPFGMFNFKTLK